MIDLSTICTFVMPFRIDSPERQRNLAFTLEWLASLNAKIILLEADAVPKIDKKFFHENVFYIFMEDSNPIFHRTHYINVLLKQVTTEIASVWDTDVVTAYLQVEKAIQNIQEGCTLAYPYNGEYVMLSPDFSEEFVKTKDLMYLEKQKWEPIFNRPFCGGAFFIDRKKYLSIGGENEHFIGWGPEDAERLRRVQIMGYLVKWTEKGKAYHLYHPRNENSRFFDEDIAIEMRRELVKVCNMNREELSKYIKNWRHKKLNHYPHIEKE